MLRMWVFDRAIVCDGAILHVSLEHRFDRRIPNVVHFHGSLAGVCNSCEAVHLNEFPQTLNRLTPCVRALEVPLAVPHCVLVHIRISPLGPGQERFRLGVGSGQWLAGQAGRAHEGAWQLRSSHLRGALRSRLLSHERRRVARPSSREQSNSGAPKRCGNRWAP